MSLPKNFAPLPASHFVRQFVIDLAELGLAQATMDDLLESGFWKEHAEKFQAGDELRVRSPNLDTVLRVVTSSPAGLIVEQIGGGAVNAAPRHLFVCRQNKAAGTWWAIWAIGDPDADGFYGPGVRWESFAPGQRNLPVLLELLADGIDRRGPFNATVTSAALEDVKQGYARLDEERALMAARRPNESVYVLCPEGRAWSEDRWARVMIDRRQAHASSKFMASQLSAEFRKYAQNMRDSINAGQATVNWSMPHYQVDIIVRPDWKAAGIAPDDFPAPVVNAEADRLANDHRKRKKAMAIPPHKRPAGWAGNNLWWLGMDF